MCRHAADGGDLGIITAPLERLTSSVRAYGRDAQEPALPVGGTREVRELSHTFVAMSNQIREKNQALLESERLATIGRMASSVSHDLRHYLAAVYANAEFLVHPNLPQGERVELFGEIRTAVHGTPISSIRCSSSATSGGGSARDPILLAHIVERAMVLVRTHPEASGMQIEMVPCAAEDTAVAADVRQLQRAVYNLLLNACQATRGSTAERRVTVRIEVAEHTLKLYIIDNGAGVADAIRTSLFEPFVSQGKQNGTGLGLTMASVVAREHGGSVTLMRSQPGETIFVFEIARTLQELHRAIPENLQEAPQ